MGRREFGALLAGGVLGASTLRRSRATHDRASAVSEPGETPLAGAAADNLIHSLSNEARSKALFALEDPERYDWHFIPKPRKGLPYKDLDQGQRQLANALLGSALTSRGFMKAATIMSLEDVLKEMDAGRGPVRDPELYYVSIFGRPGNSSPWAWRVEGHHLSLNFTMLPDGRVSSTPSFFGCNPAGVRTGSRKGLRTLAREEDLARGLLMALDGDQRRAAVVSQDAPREIIGGNARKASPIDPPGLFAARLGQAQMTMLVDLISEYANNMAREIAAVRLNKIKQAGMSRIAFAWAGGPEPGQPHYYRIQGPTFLIEYDNTQNDANHIHTVWRDFDGDFGEDLLAGHYKTDHAR